jgi:large subunit ribosomal protein L13
MKTDNQKNSQKHLERQYHQFDGQGKILGRLATQIALVLMGKTRPNYARHLDQGDFVVVTNVDGLTVSGNKQDAKIYHRFSGYPGGIHSISFRDQMKKDSRRVIHQAVYNMLPKNKLRTKMMTRLYLYKGTEHKHNAIHITHE